jgi:hypothetical protein
VIPCDADRPLYLGAWRKKDRVRDRFRGWADETRVTSCRTVTGGRLVTIETPGCPPAEIWAWELLEIYEEARGEPDLL